MFKSATIAFLLATAATSTLAAPFNVEAREPKGFAAAAGKAAGSIGGQAVNGGVGALTTWALNKLREDEVEAREPKGISGSIGKAAGSIGGQAVNGGVGALTTWALNKLREEEFEAREPFAPFQSHSIHPQIMGPATFPIGPATFPMGRPEFIKNSIAKVAREEELDAREPMAVTPLHLSSIIKIARDEELDAREPIVNFNHFPTPIGQIRPTQFINPSLNSIAKMAREEGIDIDIRDLEEYLEEYFA